MIALLRIHVRYLELQVGSHSSSDRMCAGKLAMSVSHIGWEMTSFFSSEVESRARLGIDAGAETRGFGSGGSG